MASYEALRTASDIHRFTLDSDALIRLIHEGLDWGDQLISSRLNLRPKICSR